MPDRELVPGVEVDTDLGVWQVYETPGHAPSHVVLHQPERGLLLSGDHLLGRVSLYYDYGYSPDPAGEFLSSLDVVDDLDVQLVLAGHGRPVREARALIEANRRAVHERVDRVRQAIAGGPRTPYEVVPAHARLRDADRHDAQLGTDRDALLPAPSGAQRSGREDRGGGPGALGAGGLIALMRTSLRRA